MAGGAVNEDARYWAFISYSHKDAAFGRKLHKRLESYVLPQRLVGRETPRGTVPRRLAPIFRDREELPAAGDLSAEVRAALQVSRSLIVVCSPAAAASPWVAREVETFRTLHPGRPIFAAIVDGEPAECFPGALHAIGADGARIEPLAADFRPHHDGSGLGLLKLVAGLAGVGLDELVQRDAQRKTRRVTAITAAALAAVLTMGALMIFALNARTEAVRQRGKAEGQIEFMLTDLRDKLKGVGRLDIMGAVNARALRYYADEDLNSLPVESLERRARILHAMGEDDETRGDHEAALRKFREARRTTAALLAQAPNDPDRIYDHAQSEYWIGYVDYNRGRFSVARPALLRYKALVEHLVSINPASARFHLELGEADCDLCALVLAAHQGPRTAMQYCVDALNETQTAARHLKMTREVAANLLDRYAWLADAYTANGQPERAKTERLIEEQFLDRQLVSDPNNTDLQDTWVVLQRAIARTDKNEGNLRSAASHLTSAQAAANRLVEHDPSNQQWSQLRDAIAIEFKQLSTDSRGGSTNGQKPQGH